MSETQGAFKAISARVPVDKVSHILPGEMVDSESYSANRRVTRALDNYEGRKSEKHKEKPTFMGEVLEPYPGRIQDKV